MHPTALIELTHRRINDRHARHPLPPRGKPRFVVLPRESTPLLPVRTIRQLREVKQGLLVKLTPAQFLLPHSNRRALFIATGMVATLLRRTPRLTGTQRANAQRRTEIRRTNNAGEIPIGFVAGEGPIRKTGELLQGCRFARPTRADLRALESMAIAERGHGIPIRHQVGMQINKA